jgi:hypothetical protein
MITSKEKSVSSLRLPFFLGRIWLEAVMESIGDNPWRPRRQGILTWRNLVFISWLFLAAYGVMNFFGAFAQADPDQTELLRRFMQQM